MLSKSTPHSVIPLDIAKGLKDEPVQPSHVSFPKDSKSGRSFKATWFQKHPWLEYSISKDATYCFHVVFMSGIQRGDQCFVSTGYRNWKNAMGKRGHFIKHTYSRRYINSSAAWNDFKHNQQSQRSISSTLSHICMEQVKHNRKTIIEVVLHSAFQEIALRGHREGKDARNKGNFLEIGLHQSSQYSRRMMALFIYAGIFT